MPSADQRPVSNSNKRILIIEDGRLLGSDSGLHKFFRCSHNIGKERVLYLHIDSKVLEVKRAKRNKYSCWFVGDSCIAEGDFFLATRVDPLFLALPFLEKARNKTAEHAGRFCSKEQIFIDNPDDESASILNSVTKQDDLSVLCDVQLVGDDQYFRLSDDKVLGWMRSKVFAVVEYVVADPSKEESMSEKIKLMEQADGIRSERERMIFGILLVGDYLAEQWVQSLKASFGVTAEHLTKTKEISSPGDERYRTHNSGPSKREAEQAPGSQQKKSKTSSKADKIPTKGMQAMTAFFKPTAKA
ncbi:hypothetical protein GUITHDRAFT_100952 [Guillardia theta CCMP2712]|uniref:Ribonuclease H2 subunit B wHTH domain-containing protein n=1 Tax=Guillardia theta (strain CCMP2712) TaxID=905079 RepID=L1JYF5_GUITC|nr:hypothetical protein GUITHDRAFT_100952 [Guillardia theta CCMP2712]EKX53245.1 hypothetical protein GUITHDRAFT_100952 [Guillardia theta CCMP2712]|eukprot:XP_005840225.1 hypothetical protein GUITHDRAFT_100952 [Guillardia theta CCMP2712]